MPVVAAPVFEAMVFWWIWAAMSMLGKPVYQVLRMLCSLRNMVNIHRLGLLSGMTTAGSPFGKSFQYTLPDLERFQILPASNAWLGSRSSILVSL